MIDPATCPHDYIDVTGSVVKNGGYAIVDLGAECRRCETTWTADPPSARLDRREWQ